MVKFVYRQSNQNVASIKMGDILPLFFLISDIERKLRLLV